MYRSCNPPTLVHMSLCMYCISYINIVLFHEWRSSRRRSSRRWVVMSKNWPMSSFAPFLSFLVQTNTPCLLHKYTMIRAYISWNLRRSILHANISCVDYGIRYIFGLRGPLGYTFTNRTKISESTPCFEMAKITTLAY